MELEVTDLNHEGDGVGRTPEGRVVFVPGALIGERVQVRIDQTKGRFVTAELLQRLTDARERVSPRCSVVGLCGGCGIQHLDYQAQLAWKTERVRSTLARLGGLPDVNVKDALGMDDPYAYRNKAQYQVKQADNDYITLGFYQRGTHHVVAHDQCYIVHPLIAQIATCTRQAMEGLGVSGITAVEVRVSFANNKGVLKFITRKNSVVPRQVMAELADRIRTNEPRVVGVVHAMEPGRGRRSPATQTVDGDGVLVERLGPLEFEISPDSFFQVNPRQTVKLYDTAVQMMRLLPSGSEIWDLYCGTGTIGLYLLHERLMSERCKKKETIPEENTTVLRGLDSNPASIKDAKRNAVQNGLDNWAEFEAGRAEAVVPHWLAAGFRPDACIVDPPRAGCDKELLQSLIQAQPRWIVYISCNPSTLARDLGILAQSGYRPTIVQPVDMFPHTAHIETVTLIERNT